MRRDKNSSILSQLFPYQWCQWGMWQGYRCAHGALVIVRQLVAGAEMLHLRVQGGVPVEFLSVGMSAGC